MHANDLENDGRFPRRRWTIASLGWFATSVFVVHFHPFARLIPSLDSYERIHGTWPDIVIFAVCSIVLRALYVFGFRREQMRQGIAAMKADASRGRIIVDGKRISFVRGWLAILVLLFLASIGWWGPSMKHLVANTYCAVTQPPHVCVEESQ